MADKPIAAMHADLTPETPLSLSGWKAEIDGTSWLVTEVEDSLDDGGYGTRVRCEKENSRQ